MFRSQWWCSTCWSHRGRQKTTPDEKWLKQTNNKKNQQTCGKQFVGAVRCCQIWQNQAAIPGKTKTWQRFLQNIVKVKTNQTPVNKTLWLLLCADLLWAGWAPGCSTSVTFKSFHLESVKVLNWASYVQSNRPWSRFTNSPPRFQNVFVYTELTGRQKVVSFSCRPLGGTVECFNMFYSSVSMETALFPKVAPRNPFSKSSGVSNF